MHPSRSLATSSTDLRRVGLHPDHWVPLAQSRQLARGKALGVRFAGEPIALARSESGRVFALEDRCAHRQLPLSMGVVEGEHLRCAYHAWRYRCDGRLSGIPYLPKGARPPRGVRSYPCREAYGHVFVFPGDPERAPQVPFPEIPQWDAPSHAVMYFAREVACHYSFMHENLMDMNHQFLHRGILGRIQPTLLGYERGDTWIEARYAFEHRGGRRDRGAEFLSGRRARRREAERPDVVTIRTAYPYQTLSVRKHEAREPSFELWAVYVPVDAAQRRHHSFGMLMIRKPPLPGAIHLLFPFIRRFAEAVFTEDRMAVEAEQRAWDAQGGDWNHEVHPLILDLRALLIRNGVPAQTSQGPQRGALAHPEPRPSSAPRKGTAGRPETDPARSLPG